MALLQSQGDSISQHMNSLVSHQHLQWLVGGFEECSRATNQQLLLDYPSWFMFVLSAPAVGHERATACLSRRDCNPDVFQPAVLRIRIGDPGPHPTVGQQATTPSPNLANSSPHFFLNGLQNCVALLQEDFFQTRVLSVNLVDYISQFPDTSYAIIHLHLILVFRPSDIRGVLTPRALRQGEPSSRVPCAYVVVHLFAAMARNSTVHRGGLEGTGPLSQSPRCVPLHIQVSWLLPVPLAVACMLFV